MARGQAIKHRIFVHAGSIMEEIDGEDRYHNTSVVFNREGEEIARYRKIHLFDVMTPDGTAYKESATVKAGDQVVTYDCEGVTVGCSICYDLRFPDLFQALMEKGAEMIAMPAAFTMQTGKDHWEGCSAPARSKPRPTSAPAPRPARSPSATSSGTLTAIPSSRPVGPCGRQGLGRGRYRLRPDRPGPGQEGAGHDPVAEHRSAHCARSSRGARSRRHDVWELVGSLVLGHRRLQPGGHRRSATRDIITSGALSASVRPLRAAKP